jgi:murein DD-endopeptidase MepM/ murein hydrolase activator NlpD
MEIIMISNSHRRYSLPLPRFVFFLGLLTVLFIASGVFKAGRQYENQFVLQEIMTDYKQEINSQRDLIDATKLDAEQKLDLLVSRLGRLQNEFVRLNALGGHLIKVTGLPDFNFDLMPPPQVPSMISAEKKQAPITVNGFIDRLDKLSRQTGDRKEQLVAMQSILSKDKLLSRLSPSGRPVIGGYISSLFGKRNDPFKSGKKAVHEGLDLVSDVGVPVVSTAAGVVTWSGPRYGYGNIVEVKHGYGYVTRYAHNQQNLVDTGDVIHKGQKIALLGESGRATGPHLHYEVEYKGVHLDPKEFIRVN